MSETMTVETGHPPVSVHLSEVFEMHETFHREILMMAERDANLEMDHFQPAPTSPIVNHLVLRSFVADLDEAEVVAISRIEAAAGISLVRI